MEPRHIIRAAIAVSVVGHLALAVGVYFADARPFDPSVTQDIAVDIVTPQQAAEAVKEAEKPPEPEKQPDPFRLPELSNKQSMSDAGAQAASASKPPAAKPPDKATKPSPSQAAQQQPPPAQQPSQQAPAQPAPPQQHDAQQQDPQQAAQQGQPQPQQQAAAAQSPPPASAQPPLQQQAALQPSPEPLSSPTPPAPEPDITVKYGVMLGLPDGNGGAAAIAKADIAPLDIDAFRRHLRSCSKLPSAISATDKVRVVLRAFLAPNGRLTTEPMLIEAPASAKGPLLMQAAMKALEACQPYAMLPADKYNEWKVLDLPFTPQDFAG